MKNIIVVFIVLIYSSITLAQKADTAGINSGEKKSIGIGSVDPYRLDYKDVYDNMNYDQPLRPQVHYTPITGQIADPTGLVKYKGVYHLFYMSDEWSNQRRDNKNWGHAISTDCIYWSQEPHITNSIIDNRPGSGSGIVDWNNSLGLRRGIEKTMVIFYTDYGRGISLAFSNDAGKTWIRHKSNPLITGSKSMRDPNVFWYKPDQSWRMVLYEEHGVSFYKSKNLLNWQLLSKMGGFFECPDFINIPVDNDENNKKWVLIDGNGSYYVGGFDGTQFKPESKKNPLGNEVFLNNDAGHINYYTKDLYATQTWKQSYEGDGPFYQLAFMMVKNPPRDRIWSQQLIFPVELTLKKIDQQIRLCRNPISAIKQLRYDPHFWNHFILKPGENPLNEINGDVFEILTDIDLGSSKTIIFDIRGEKVTYNVKDHQLEFLDSKISVIPQKNKITLHFIIDRNSVEIYANQGEATLSRLFYPDKVNRNLSVQALGGECLLDKMELYRLESIWLPREQQLGNQKEIQPLK